jgi:arginine utilization protein RocB
MIEAVPVLLELAQEYDLEYKTCLNSEPVFSNYPGDKNQYIYTGSLGKLLPGFLCYGIETHVGEPFSGLNANYMVSELTREIELNVEYCEVVEGEVTPPPSNLMQKDLKEEYSVQIPHVAVSLFNILTMEKTVEEFSQMLLGSARVVAKRIEQHASSQARQFAKWQNFIPKNLEVKVLTYAELLEHAIQNYGEAEIVRRQSYIIANFKELGDRDLSTRLVSDLASLCKDQAPMIVLFYSPPFYPAISSKEHPVVQEVVDALIQLGKEKYELSFKQQYYFSGLSDLSFAGLQQPAETLTPLIENMPLFGKSYQLPITLLKQLNIPVMNFGPMGRDAHKWTERLNVSYSFGIFPNLLEAAIKKLLAY